MALTVTVNNENFPEGYKFEIIGLGEFENGTSKEITEDEERVFVGLHQMSLEDRIGTDSSVEVSGSSTIDNIDEILGQDVSDRPAPPQESILENPCVSEDDPAKRVLNGLPPTPEDEVVEEEAEKTHVTTIGGQTIESPDNGGGE